jgi:hypothetical protein
MTIDRYVITDLPSNAERDLFKNDYRLYDKFIAYLMENRSLQSIAELDCGMCIRPNFPEWKTHRIGNVMVNPRIDNYLVQVFYHMCAQKEKQYVTVKCSAILSEEVFSSLLSERLRKWPDWVIFGHENCLATANGYTLLEDRILDQIKLNLHNESRIELENGHHVSPMKYYEELVNCFLGKVTKLVKKFQRDAFSSVNDEYVYKSMVLSLMPEVIKSRLTSPQIDDGKKWREKIVKPALSAYQSIISEAETIWCR